MGSAVVKLVQREPKFVVVENSKVAAVKDVDTRRRNSLMFFMREWQECETFEQQEASMVQVGRHGSYTYIYTVWERLRY